MGMKLAGVDRQEWHNAGAYPVTVGRGRRMDVSRMGVAAKLVELKQIEIPEGLTDEEKKTSQTGIDNAIELAKLGLECYDEGAIGFNHAMRIPRCRLIVELHGLEKHEVSRIEKMKTDRRSSLLIDADEKINNREIEIAKAKLEYFDSL